MAIFKTFKVSNKDAFLLTKAVQTTLLNEQKKKVYPKNFPEQQKIIEDLKNLFNELCKQHSEQIEI